MTIEPRFAFALDYVEDIEASKRFYTEVMGLRAEREAPTFVQFGAFAIASDEAVGPTRAMELYWTIENAQAAYDELSAKGQVDSPIQELPFGRVFTVLDPDGHPRYLLEWATSRPSYEV